MIDIGMRRRRRPHGPVRSSVGAGPTLVQCGQCSEPHPIVRLAGGEERCVTAFYDGTHWFCRNRGCRRAWLERSGGL